MLCIRLTIPRISIVFSIYLDLDVEHAAYIGSFQKKSISRPQRKFLPSTGELSIECLKFE